MPSGFRIGLPVTTALPTKRANVTGRTFRRPEASTVHRISTRHKRTGHRKGCDVHWTDGRLSSQPLTSRCLTRREGHMQNIPNAQAWRNDATVCSHRKGRATVPRALPQTLPRMQRQVRPQRIVASASTF
eukprot:scaffold77003_cov33-Tisochrysis_lutea.AAC.7